MALELRQQLKLTQQLIITPQLQMAITAIMENAVETIGDQGHIMRQPQREHVGRGRQPIA